MLTNTELEQRFVRSNLTEAGRNLVRQARAVGPARDVKHRYGGVRTSYVSGKTGLQVLTESRKVELSALVTYEHDSAIEEVWAQPFSYDIKVTDRNGHPRRVTVTPDFLLIRGTAFLVEEWREEQRLERLARERPADFGKDANGVWHFYPAEQAFHQLGFDYRLCSSRELQQVRVSNVMFLRDIVSSEAPKATDDEIRRLQGRFAERSAIPFLQLVHEDGFKANDVYQAIAREDVYVDIGNARLDIVDSLIVYRDRLSREAAVALSALPKPQPPDALLRLKEGTQVSYEGRRFTIALVGSENATLVGASGEHTQLRIEVLQKLHDSKTLTVSPTPSDNAAFDLGSLVHAPSIETALSRLRALNSPNSAPVSARTVRRWRKLRNEATSPQGALRALMPKRKTGQRQVTGPVYEIAKTVANEFFNTAKCPTRNAAYLVFKSACSKAQLAPVARSTFYLWCDDLESTLARKGRRAAYAEAPIRQLNDDTPPRHGTHRHNVLYIDHTLLNIRVAGRLVDDLGKPWLTLGIDGTGEPMAMYFDFGAPSTQSVMMLLRDYVLRHGRLPDVIVLDNGREFHSAALSNLCLLFDMQIRWRRASMPRDSSLVERLFGTTETEILAQLDGNTRAMKDPRSVSPSHKPERHVRWTLPALYAAFEAFLFDVYINRTHPRYGITLAELRERQRVELGDRSHVFVRYDEVFRLLTAVHPQRKATRVVDYRLGVYVNGIYYWHQKLAKAKRAEVAEVRVEMWRARVVYVRFRDEWLVAEARDGGRLEGRFLVEYEGPLRKEEQSKRSLAQEDANSLRVAQQKAALWMPERWDERLREQCVEMHLVYAARGMGEAMPEAANPKASMVVLATQGSAQEVATPADVVEPATEQAAIAPSATDNGFEYF